MKFEETFILVGIVCSLLSEIAAAGTSVTRNPQVTSRRISSGDNSRKIHPAWIQKLCQDARRGFPQKKFFKRQSSMSDGDDGGDSGDSGDSSSGSSDSMMTTLKSYLKKLPQTNFYSTMPNAVGVVGQGLSVLEKVSIALGTPLPYFIGSLPLVLFGIALVFIPDFTTLSLPGFYPNGAGEHDPLSAFPPYPSFDGFPDIDLSLTPENIPPRIIPPSASKPDKPDPDQPSLLSPPAESVKVQNVEDEDSPTNPESFQAPRRRMGESVKPAKVPYVQAKPLQSKTTLPYHPQPLQQPYPQNYPYKLPRMP